MIVQIIPKDLRIKHFLFAADDNGGAEEHKFLFLTAAYYSKTLFSMNHSK